MFTTPLYRDCPVIGQEILIGARTLVRRVLREGRAFRNAHEEVLRTQWATGNALTDYRERKLSEVLRIAAESVPFYRENVDPVRVRALPPSEALKLFPIIDKSIVRAAGDRMLSEVARKPLVSGTTSGTTGSPLRLMQDLAAVNREHAFIHRQLEWAGFRAGDRRAWMRGDLVVHGDVNKPPYWRRNPLYNMLMLSAFHLSNANAPLYLEALKRHDPHVIQAYPSAIKFLASFLKSNDQQFQGASLRGIVTSSETLGDADRALIENAFGCPVHDWYGQFERVAAIGTCEHGRAHVMDDYSFVEFEAQADDTQEIIGTGFGNLAMPLVRYRTGDRVSLASGAPCPCRREFMAVERVLGRADECIKLPDGRNIGHLYRIFNEATGVIEGQVVQDREGQAEIRVVPSSRFTERDERSLIEALRARTDQGFEVSVVRVEALSRNRAGKVRNVVCNI